MSVEYTNEAIDYIRALAREGWPHGAVAARVGWDIGRLLRMAEKHKIDFRKIVAKSKTPDPVKANIYWDGREAWHGRRHVYLSAPEGRIFSAILKHQDYDWNTEKMGGAAEIPKKNVPAHISQLREKLERIGLTLTRYHYELTRL